MLVWVVSLTMLTWQEFIVAAPVASALVGMGRALAARRFAGAMAGNRQ